MCSFSQALHATTKSKKNKKKRSSSERRNESETKEIKECAVLEIANLAAEQSKKRKEKKKKRAKEEDVEQPASTTTSKIPSCSASSDKEDKMEVEVSRVRTKSNREVVSSKSSNVSSFKAGKKRSSTTTEVKPSGAPESSNTVPIAKKRKLTKTTEIEDKTKQKLTSKLGVPSERRDTEDAKPKSAGKTLRVDIAKPVIASKVRASRKAVVASNVSTTDSSSDTDSSDSDDLPKSKTTRTPLSSSENASKALPPITEMRVPPVTKPPPKDSSSEETSDESSSDSDGNPWRE